MTMPVATLQRRMTVVRLHDGRLVIFSAIALDEDEMKKLEDFGTPAFLIVPCDNHRLDAKIWKDRYPGMTVVAPEGAREKVEKVVHVDSNHAEFGDTDVSFIIVPGTRGHEAALEIEGANGTTLVVNDIIANIRHASGFGGSLRVSPDRGGNHRSRAKARKKRPGVRCIISMSLPFAGRSSRPTSNLASIPTAGKLRTRYLFTPASERSAR